MSSLECNMSSMDCWFIIFITIFNNSNQHQQSTIRWNDHDESECHQLRETVQCLLASDRSQECQIEHRRALFNEDTEEEIEKDDLEDEDRYDSD